MNSGAPQGASSKGKLIIIIVIVLLVLFGAARMFGFFRYGGVVVPNLNGGNTIVTDKGTASWNTGTLPSSWPSDFPVYPSATIVTSGTGTSNETGTTGMTASLTTGDASTAVQAFYTGAFATNGWAVKGSQSFGGQIMMAAEKGNRTAIVTIAPGSNGTSIVMAVGTK